MNIAAEYEYKTKTLVIYINEIYFIGAFKSYRKFRKFCKDLRKLQRKFFDTLYGEVIFEKVKIELFNEKGEE